MLSNFVTASSTALGVISHKVRGLLSAGQSTQLTVDEEIRRDRERQSMRIKLRMLTHEGRIEELVQLAENTTDEETSRVAVAEIDEATPGNSAYLERLCRGRSASTMRAIVRLYNRKEVRLARDIFLEHLQEGTFAQLVADGSVKLFSILDLLGAFEQDLGTETILVHFANLWRHVDQDPVKSNLILCEMLGDPEPGGFRCIYEPSLVPKAVRQKALELLRIEDPAGCERACIYATNDEDREVAYPAAAWLYNHWQSQVGMVPDGIEPMPMLDVNLLYQLCAMTTSFQWGDSEHADRLVEQFLEMKEQLANCDRETEPVEYDRLDRKIEAAERELRRTTERRINRLQPLVDEVCSALRLPNPRLLPSDDDGSEASYCVGMGVIKINRNNLLTDQPLSERLMSAMLHEICHMQQDVLIIRMIADDLNLKFGQHGKLLIPLWDRYSEGVGYAPDNVFLLAVLRLRADQPLSEAERKRAVRLYDDALQLNYVSEAMKAVKRRRSHLEQSLDLLQQGAYDAQLLMCLRNQSQLEKLFQSGRIPEVLLQELSYCKDAVDRLAETWAPRTRDTISFAQQLFQSEYRVYVSPIIDRLRRVLCEVLDEELKILRRKNSQLKRDGYQEAEAYVISDRADVIIKAMRQGWFDVR